MKIVLRLSAAIWLPWVSQTPSQAAPANGFKHIVIIVQENRTPDNLFGSNPKFEPGVDIATGTTLPGGKAVRSTAVPINGCYDPSHTHAAFEAELASLFTSETTASVSNCAGAAPPAYPAFAYVDNSSGAVQPYFDLAENYGFANRMFQTNQGPSFPAHQFLFGGTSAPTPDSPLFVSENPVTATGNSGNILDGGCVASTGTTVALIDGNGSESTNKPMFPRFDHPTLSDKLAANQLTWRYYAVSASSIWNAPSAIRHICVPGTSGGTSVCTGAAFVANDIQNPSQIISDVAACNLANVSWVTPSEPESDHPGNTGLGPQWVATIVNAIGRQRCTNERYWRDTAIFITWDDWGGWFDHVIPFANTKPIAWGAGYSYGFRVPLLVVSAYTPAGYVNNGTLDFGSILRFTEVNFNFGFIGVGSDTFNHYADYQSSLQGRGSLSSFFSLDAPRSFEPIATATSADYFTHEPSSNLPPDND